MDKKTRREMRIFCQVDPRGLQGHKRSRPTAYENLGKTQLRINLRRTTNAEAPSASSVRHLQTNKRKLAV